MESEFKSNGVVYTLHITKEEKTILGVYAEDGSMHDKIDAVMSCGEGVELYDFMQNEQDKIITGIE